MDLILKEKIIKDAVNSATKIYLEELRTNIDGFVDRTFSVSESWEINKKALGKDMLKAPVNVLWTPVYFALTGIGHGLKKLKFDSLSNSLTNLPAGFTTDVEKEIEWRIYSEFLMLPFESENRVSSKNRLLELILEDDSLKPILSEGFSAIHELGMNKDGEKILANNLLQYVDSRKAASELSATLLGAAASFATTKSVNLGALGLGQTVAASAAYHSAVSSFALGPTLGGFYYSIMPASAPAGAVVLSTGGVAALLGVVAAFGGVVADPIQRKLGLHQKKLHKLVDTLESQLVTGDKADLQLADGYVARVLDIVDLLITVAVKK